MSWCGKGVAPQERVQLKSARGRLDPEKFIERLDQIAADATLRSASQMLRKKGYVIHWHANKSQLQMVIEPPKTKDRVYAFSVDKHGHYWCCTAGLKTCAGMRGTFCKHILMGVQVAANEKLISLTELDRWLNAAVKLEPTDLGDAASNLVSKYDGAKLKHLAVDPESFK